MDPRVPGSSLYQETGGDENGQGKGDTRGMGSRGETGKGYVRGQRSERGNRSGSHAAGLTQAANQMQIRGENDDLRGTNNETQSGRDDHR